MLEDEELLVEEDELELDLLVELLLLVSWLELLAVSEDAPEEVELDLEDSADASEEEFFDVSVESPLYQSEA